MSPNFWTDPTSGIPYYIAVQTPERELSSLGDLKSTPVSTTVSPNGDPIPGMLSNVATVKRESLPANANQSNIQPVYEVYASTEGRDLGSVSSADHARSSARSRPSSRRATTSRCSARSRA